MQCSKNMSHCKVHFSYVQENHDAANQQHSGISHRWQVHQHAAVAGHRTPPPPPPMPTITAPLSARVERCFRGFGDRMKRGCDCSSEHRWAAERGDPQPQDARTAPRHLQICKSQHSDCAVAQPAHRVPAVQPGVASHGPAARRSAVARRGRAMPTARAQHLCPSTVSALIHQIIISCKTDAVLIPYNIACRFVISNG